MTPSLALAPPATGNPDGAAGALGVLRRRFGLFAGVFAAVMAASVAALLMLPVQYIATGSVIVAEPEPGSNNANASIAWIQKLGDPADIESQLLVIRSPRMLRLMASGDVVERVAAECRMGGGADCDRMRGNLDLVVEHLQRRVVAANAGRSRVISIGYRSPSPETSQALTNALITTYLDDQRSVLASSRLAATDWLWKEIKRLDGALQDGEARIQEYRRRKGLMQGAQAPIASERLTAINGQLLSAETAMADAAARLGEINADQARGSINAPAVLASRAIGDLKNQINVATAQLANLGTSLGPNHPAVKALQTERASLKDRVDREVASIAASLKKSYDASSALAKSLRQQLETVKREVATAMDDEAAVAGMTRNQEIMRSQYADLYKRASEFETERRILVGSTRLVSLADLPGAPASPKPALVLTGGFILALALAGGAVLLRERAARGIPTSSELSAATHAPVFAQLPSLDRGGALARLSRLGERDPDRPLAAALLAAREDPLMQQALRDLDARLILAGNRGGGRSILITSAEPGEGKSFTALALAQVSAAAGRQVLVIECDLRRPVAAEALGLADGPGVAGVLSGAASPGRAVMQTADPRVDVIPAGAPTAASTSLLMGDRMENLLAWARRYDLVLIDAPPAGLLMDAHILAGKVDGVLCCTRWDRTAPAATVAAVQGMREAGGAVLGIAINMVRTHDHPLYRTWGGLGRRYIEVA